MSKNSGSLPSADTTMGRISHAVRGGFHPNLMQTLNNQFYVKELLGDSMSVGFLVWLIENNVERINVVAHYHCYTVSEIGGTLIYL